MRTRLAFIAGTTLLFALPALAGARFSVSFPKELSPAPLDGRLLLIVSTDPSAEPRMQVNDTPNTQMVFGLDVDGLPPGQPAMVDERAFGYPVQSLTSLKPGQYYVQAVLHLYETFLRSDGHTVKQRVTAGRHASGAVLSEVRSHARQSKGGKAS